MLALAALLATAAPAAPAVPAAASDEALARFEQAAAAAGTHFQKLDLLRVADGVEADPATPATIKATVGDGLAQFDAADKILAESLAALEPPSAAAASGEAVRKPGERPETAALRWKLTIRRCQLALLRGELQLRAGAALPMAAAARADYLKSAGEVFRYLRVDYSTIPLSLMGYIGEARALRLSGHLAEAREVLATVLKDPRRTSDPAVMDLCRAARIEEIEITLAENPEKALAAAAALETYFLPKERLEGSGQTGWLTARGKIIGLEKRAAAAIPGAAAGTSGSTAAAAATAKSVPAAATGAPVPAAVAASLRKELDEVAALLRSDPVFKAAPALDRLALLARADQLFGGQLMTRVEFLQWADVLASAGRSKAADAYAAAVQRFGGTLGLEQLLFCSSMQWRLGRFGELADTCDLILAQMAANDPRRSDLVQLRAAALLKNRDASGGPRSDPDRERLQASLAALVDSSRPPEIRRESLRQWVALQGGHGGMGSCVKMLAAHDDLVLGDAYLEYSLAAGQWQNLSARLAAAAATSPPPTTPAPKTPTSTSQLSPPAPAEPTGAAEEARQTAARLQAAEQSAAKANDNALLARAALLRTRIMAGPPLNDPRAALQVVEDRWSTLSAESATANDAALLRIELMMELGLVDQAVEALGKVDKAAGQPSADLPLRVAESISERFDRIEPARRAAVQQQVTTLCNRAMEQSIRDEQSYVATGRRTARLLLRVEAHADAERTLKKLATFKAISDDPEASLDVSQMLAECLLKSGQLNDARKLLDSLATQYPKSAELALTRGRCQATLREPDAAVASFRQARELSAPGSAIWCRATLELAGTLRQQRHAAAARDVLRVALALYPQFGDAELLLQARQLTEQLKGSRDEPPESAAHPKSSADKPAGNSSDKPSANSGGRQP